MLSNKAVSLKMDDRGRIISLINKHTGSELIEHPKAAETFRLVIPTDRHRLAFVYGSQQKPKRIELSNSRSGQSLAVFYETLSIVKKKLPISIRLSLQLEGDDAVIRARIEIKNRSKLSIDEVEFPVIGGLGGFKAASGGKELQAVLMERKQGSGRFLGDFLNCNLPDTGRESNHFVREHDTAMWQDSFTGNTGLDFYGANEGLYISYNTTSPQDFVHKVERYPKAGAFGTLSCYPKGTQKWLRFWGVHIPQIAPGATWESEPVTIHLHKGGWHSAAEWYARNVIPAYKYAEPPAWMEDFTGWTEIIGNLYTGEIFHDFKTCAEQVIADKKVTGLNLLFYYGHTNLGAEGADYDQSPAEELGGEKGFAKMIQKLHANGIRIILLDHLHRYINSNIPEYTALNLERLAVRDEENKLCEARWWKETALSCLRLKGPTPVWIDICPSCPEWQEHYLEHVKKMIARGVDGLELDCFDVGRCYSRNHSHEPGADMMPVKIDFMRRVRAEAKALNPDFLFVYESMSLATRQTADAWYPYRYVNEHGRIHRFISPGLRQQAVLVGNYSYDSVNKAIQLGIGVETEIWGLRKTTLAGCPELAKHIGEVNKFKRRHRHILIQGTFRDTLGARVKGGIYHSVINAENGEQALVLRNPTANQVKVEASLDGVSKHDKLLLWQPFQKEKRIRSLPLKITLPASGLAVLLKLKA